MDLAWRIKMKQVKVLVEIPISLKDEVNKFLVEKAEGESLQGSLKIIVVRSLSNYLIEKGWKLSSKASKDVAKVVQKGRFKL
jgi:hypothetical protein